MKRRSDWIPPQQRISPEYFWPKVDVGAPDACWPWRGERTSHGYGVLYLANKRDRKRVGAHRIAYLLHYETDPGSLDVLHRCDNPPCCNPGHLFLGTAKDNSDDARSKARLRGFPRKVDADQVEEIRRRYAAGEPPKDIAQSFPISNRQVRRIGAGISRNQTDDQMTPPAWQSAGFRRRDQKLTDSEVAEAKRIYARGGITQRVLAKQLGINQGYLCKILKERVRVRTGPNAPGAEVGTLADQVGTKAEQCGPCSEGVFGP